MELTPRLIDVSVPASPRAVVIVLHGGASRRHGMGVSPTQLSVLRMIPIARRIARAGRGELAVLRLLNSRRGWETSHTPLQDVRWALEEVQERFGALAVGLVGHSLGGRAALLAAPEVRSVVALAPWVYATDVPAGLDGQRVLIVHGAADRIASPGRAAAVASNLRRLAQVGFISVVGGKHAMLRRHGAFSGAAADFLTSTLLDRDPSSSAVRQILDGAAWVET